MLTRCADIADLSFFCFAYKKDRDRSPYSVFSNLATESLLIDFHHHGRSLQSIHFILNAHAGRGWLLSTRGANSCSPTARLSISATIRWCRTTTRSKLWIYSAAKPESEPLSPHTRAASRWCAAEKLHACRAARLFGTGHDYRNGAAGRRQSSREPGLLVRVMRSW